MGKRTIVNGFLLLTLVSLLVGGCGPQMTPTPTAEPDVSPSPTLESPTPPPGKASPIVIQRTPEPGAELAPDGEIELVFDRAMDRTSVEKAINVSPGVTGSVEWADERTVRFKPARDLKRDSEYQVTLRSGAKAADGESLEDDYRFRFRTVGYLAVSQVVPAPGAANVEAESVITVIFNRPVVPLTAVSDPAYEELPRPLALDPPVKGQGEWINSSIYKFTPDGPLAGGSTYTARIEAGLTDTTGGLLEETHSWQFTTQPPKVTWVSPQRDEELVSVEPIIQVDFNMPVDPESAEEAFSLRGDGVTVDGVVEVVSSTLFFTPTEQLAFDTVYTARVDRGVLSLRGGEGMPTPFEWRFTTVPLPRIIGTRPSDGQQGTDSHRPFEILFNAPVDPKTVMPNVEMSPPLSPTQVYTYFSPHDNVFRIGFGSQPSTDYEVRIGPDISDPYGNTTGQELTISYRTGPLDPTVQLDVPGTIGTYNASRRAQVLVGHLNVDRLDMRLGRIDPDDYADVQDRFWETRVAADGVRQWSVTVEAPLNEKRHVPVDLAADGGTLDPGLYLLEVRAPGVSFEPWMHRRMLAVSDYNLTIKRSQKKLWVWATELESGKPADGIQLEARQPNVQPAGPVTTDENGLAQFDTQTRYERGLHVISQEPFVLGGVGWEWEQGISPWEFGLQGGYDERDHRVHITTDRPLYRAGQTVHFRGVVRAQDDVDYSLPTVQDVLVEVRSANGEEVYRQELELDEYGAFHGDLKLDEGAALGDYQILAKVGSTGYGSTFTVAAYRPPEFEVMVTPERRELVAGRATQANVEASYFFGGGVADVDVSWRVLSRPYRFEAAQFGRYDFTDDDDPWICRWCWWRPAPSPKVILEGSGKTDDEGHLSIGLPTEIMTGGQRLTVEATAYGKDGQAISGRDDIIVHRGDFYIGLAPQQRVGKAGQEMGIDLVTVDWEGKRVPDMDLDVEVYRREWINTFVENGRGGTWQWETEDTLVYTDTVATSDSAAAQVSFSPSEGGSYRVVVSDHHGRGTAEDGTLVRSSTWLWVSGTKDVSWRRENNDRFDLISDQSSYVPGETAEILIPSPFRGEQWA
ncbi:MAG: Ig-like domain-containing protein, partial [Anaerolineae bacterium]